MAEDRPETGRLIPTPSSAEKSDALRILEQTGAVRWTNGEWVHEAETDAQEKAEAMLAKQFGRERARRLVRFVLAETSVETPPKPR